VQGALLHLLKNNWAVLQNWPKERSLMSWAAVAARNNMIDQIRHARVDALAHEIPGDPDLSPEAMVEPVQQTVLELTEALNCIQGAKAELSHRQLNIIFLRHSRGLQYREIAEALQIAIGSVGTILARAEQTLRGLIERNCRHHLPTLLSHSEAMEVD
jgi:RNA polymerase sigma factor (sigma-70 family)